MMFTFSSFENCDRPLSPRAGDCFRPRVFGLDLPLVVDEDCELTDSAEGDAALSPASVGVYVETNKSNLVYIRRGS